MDFRLLNSVSSCIEENGVEKLILLEDLDFFEKMGCGLYDIDLSTYITFNSSHMTRHGTLNPHFDLDLLQQNDTYVLISSNIVIPVHLYKLSMYFAINSWLLLILQFIWYCCWGGIKEICTIISYGKQ